MATRIVNTPGAQMSITNRSATPLVAGPVFLQSGQTRSFPLKYVSDSWSYGESLSAMLQLGSISVSFDNPGLGYYALGVTDPNYFESVVAPSATSLGTVSVYTTALRPAPDDVPEGFQIFNTTTAVVETAIGAFGARAWL